MSFAKVVTAQAHLLGASLVSVETDISRGLHSFSIVGLADKVIEEAKDRIGAAIKNSGFPSPKSKNQKVIISLAPADLKKEGTHFDVPMGISYLLASGEISCNCEKKLFIGELSLDGKLRPVPGVLSLVREAARQGFSEIYLPAENAEEASLISSVSLYPVSDFKSLIEHLIKKKSLTLYNRVSLKSPEEYRDIDFADIKGQDHAKRALEIAAAGGHNCALYGPPGTGKTMLTRAFIHILPNLSFEEMLDTTSIHSVAGILKNPTMYRPPFRSPHHTSSYTSIIGGGSSLRPGELTLAHNGVLFLDEFLEFDRRTIDALRQPLEEHSITISRTKGSLTLPARTLLLIAFNPCPCGFFGVPDRECTCTPSTLLRYQKKLSGPIIDRIDLWSQVAEVKRKALTEGTSPKPITSDIRARVIAAREVQRKRFESYSMKKLNNEMNHKELRTFCPLEKAEQELLILWSERLKLSSRAHTRVLKVARTIADLAGKEKIDSSSILEALQYRPKFSLFTS
jgi:magnesium chelatase family protein